MVQTIALDYEGKISRALLQAISPQSMPEGLEDPVNITYQVTVGEQAIRIITQGTVDLEWGVEAMGQRHWLIDHGKRRYVTYSASPQRTALQDRFRSEEARLNPTDCRRTVKIGSHSYTVRNYEGAIGDASINAWVFDRSIGSRALAQAYWAQLLPWVTSAAFPGGFLHEATLMMRAGEIQIKVSRMNLRAAAPKPFEPPDGYERGFDALPVSNPAQGAVGSDVQKLRETSRREMPVGSRRSPFRSAQGILDIELADSLSGRAPTDFAWYIKNDFLTQVRGILNLLASTQDGYRLRLGNLFIDWWSGDMRWHINPDQPADPGSRYNVLMKLVRSGLLALRVINDEDFLPAESDRARDYHRLMGDIAHGQADNDTYLTVNGPGQRTIDISTNIETCRNRVEAFIDSLVDNNSLILPDAKQEVKDQLKDILVVPVCRYVLLCKSELRDDLANYCELPYLNTLFTSEITQAYEEQLFDQLTADRVVAPIPASVLEGAFQDILRYGIDNLDGYLNLRNDDNDSITGLGFAGGGLEVEITIPQVQLDFYWWTHPIATSLKGFAKHLALATLGIPSGLALSNAGWGSAALDDARLVFKISPERADEDEQVLFGIHFDRGRSTVDTSLWTRSINLGNTVWIGILDLIASLCDLVKLAIFDGLVRQIDDLGLGRRWPADFWNAHQGPAVRTQWPTLNGLMRGQLAAPNEMPGAWIDESTVRHELFSSTAYLYTASYLTGWARQKIGTFAPEVFEDNEQSNWEQILGGITLPDPATLPDPDLGNTRAELTAQNAAASLLARTAALQAGNPLNPVDCGPPRTQPTEYFYRLRILRSQPRVSLPFDGEIDEIDYIGTLEIDYEVRLEAVRVAFIPSFVGVSNAECQQMSVGILLTMPSIEGTIWPEAAGKLIEQARSKLGRSLPTQPSVELRDRYELDELQRPLDRGANVGYTPTDPNGDWQPPGTEPPQGVPEIPGLGELGGLSGSLLYCQNPRCEWTEVRDEKVLATYLQAKLTVDTDLRVGFRRNGSLWPPEMELGLRGQPTGVELDTASLITQSPLDNVNPDLLRGLLQQWVLYDSSALIERVEGELETRLNLVPVDDFLATVIQLEDLFAVIADDVPESQRDDFMDTLLNIARIEFEADSINEFRYLIHDGVAYLPMRLVERLGEIIEV